MDSTFSKSQVLEFGKTSNGLFSHSFSNILSNENKLGTRASVRESRGSDFELNDRIDED